MIDFNPVQEYGTALDHLVPLGEVAACQPRPKVVVPGQLIRVPKYHPDALAQPLVVMVAHRPRNQLGVAEATANPCLLGLAVAVEGSPQTVVVKPQMLRQSPRGPHHAKQHLDAAHGSQRQYRLMLAREESEVRLQPGPVLERVRPLLLRVQGLVLAPGESSFLMEG